ncbi:hypothetical protein, partial [Ruegeria sp. HKCCD6119]|uniref:hypothetical protein n=1 Tax=Ruegeria sp. HKCCD6119 TaxID=2683003 RepID=UPI001C0F7142
QAHNLKVVGSNPTPATNITYIKQYVTHRLKAVLQFVPTPLETLWKQAGVIKVVLSGYAVTVAS